MFSALLALWVSAASASPVELARAAVSSPPGSLELSAVRRQGPREVVIFEQRHLGLPVAGGRVVVAVQGGAASILADSALRDLPAVLPALLSPADEARLLAAALPRAGWVEPASRQWWRGRVIAVARAQSLDGSRSWRLRMDASTGQLLELLPDRLHAGEGLVHDNAPGADHLVQVSLPDLVPDASGMEGLYVDVASQGFGPTGAAIRVRHATPDEAGDYLLEPVDDSVEDGFVEVNAYWHVTQSRAYFADTFGHPVPDRIQVTTNYQDAPDTAFDNAYFSYGAGGIYTLTFGQGSVADFGYDPGIILHEFGHGVVEDLAALFTSMSYPINLDEYGLHAAPGGLTEGLPDYWSTTQTDRSAVGIFDDGSSLRDVDNSATCPESVVGEAHQDGVVIGGATWEIRQRIGAERADAVIYRAIGSMGGAPTYADFAAALLSAGGTLVDEGLLTEAELTDIGAIVDARGLSGCGRDVALAEGAPVTSTMIGADFIDASYCEPLRNLGIQIPVPFQLTVTVPEDPTGARQVTAVTLDLDLDPLRGGDFAEGDLDYTVYVAGDELVRYALNPLNVFGYTFLLPTGAENAVATVEGSPASVVIDATAFGAEALPAGGSLSIGLIGLNCRTAEVTASATFTWSEVVTDEEPGDDLNDGAAAEDGGGDCGCGKGGSAALLLLPALLLGRRRRR
jgi:hypothetical protein